MTELKTKAEQEALKATQLPSFRNVALAGLKEQVSEMLGMIGHTAEIFATYTKHDISHINAMLKHLDWLIPPSTQSAMTPVDWMLITLAIYFHDLGMLVTAEEFAKRMENGAFTKFMAQLGSDPKSQDYLARARKMSEEQRERFFFQEFIRENHASRVKEWITGKHSSHWGKSTKVISDEIFKLMQPFPARFRENLGTVCESHHRPDLNKLEFYPLAQRYGNEPLEIANVQYAALILRTVDLIHVTKDRTPSIMYKLISFSDPKGVEEWDKQKDAFAVRHAGRVFDPKDEKTHYITVSADFTEERPFFALTEYIAWADGEIKQTKRWSDQSKEEKDGAEFWFPWDSIRGDLRVEGNQPLQMRFDFDRGRLLDLLVGHAIYNDATVAIRELLQNAIDAVRFQNHLEIKEAEALGKKAPPMGRVKVTWDPKDRRLVIEDEGTGMDLDTIKHHLLRVGSSFYDTPQFALEHRGFTPISRFGIGILTCFMISDDIEIVTFKKNLGHRIRMTSVHADYLLRDLQPGDGKLDGLEPHGTRVTVIVREGDKLKDVAVEKILRYWIVLPACKVDYSEAEKHPVAIGFQSPAEALRNYYEEAAKGGQKISEDLEIISKRQVVAGGEYVMAMAVSSGWLPEKAFEPLRLEARSAVCIEGISVSEALPGFAVPKSSRRDYGLGALVSVRGVRGLRTTVSRASLEEDEEFVKVGKICAEMLFEHVADEVKRISGENGKPLSRASSAGKWLCHDLLRQVQSESIQLHINALRRKLPVIVMESGEMIASGPKPQRTLVSPESLSKGSHFWTIESRLVDSLGTISRDLGRELSLNEFLGALAPDYAALRYSPILPDAQIFSSDILEHLYPALVQFSRGHQQTAIKWVPGKGLLCGKTSRDSLFDETTFADGLRKEYQKLTQGQEIPIGDSAIAIADLEGDEPQVEVVRTRVISVVKKSTELARVLTVVESAMADSRKRKDPEMCAVWYCVGAVAGSLISKNRGRSGWESDQLRRGLAQLWGRFAPAANEIGSKRGFKAAIPEQIDFVSPGSIFDASFYWRDWLRVGGRDPFDEGF
jgi:hypothetical protein